MRSLQWVAEATPMAWDQRVWTCVALVRNKPGCFELWQELCAELEKIAQQGKYATLGTTGDGVPDA